MQRLCWSMWRLKIKTKVEIRIFLSTKNVDNENLICILQLLLNEPLIQLYFVLQIIFRTKSEKKILWAIFGSLRDTVSFHIIAKNTNHKVGLVIKYTMENGKEFFFEEKKSAWERRWVARKEMQCGKEKQCSGTLDSKTINEVTCICNMMLWLRYFVPYYVVALKGTGCNMLR